MRGRICQATAITNVAVYDRYHYWYQEELPVSFDAGKVVCGWVSFINSTAYRETLALDIELIDPDGQARGTCYNTFYAELDPGSEGFGTSHNVILDENGIWKIHAVVKIVSNGITILDEGTWNAVKVSGAPPPPPPPPPAVFWGWIALGGLGIIGLVLLSRREVKHER